MTMKRKPLIKTIAAIAIAGSAVLLLCSRQTPPTQIDLSNRAQQSLAQAYFRLGVSTSCSVILRHQIAGEKIPEPQSLLKECIEQDIAASNGKTLLKLP